MKRIFVLLLLVAVLISISAVSANENMTLSDCPLGNDEVGTELVDSGERNDVSFSRGNDEKMLNSSDSGQSSESDHKKTNSVVYKATSKNIKSTYGKTAKYNLKLVDKSSDVIVGKQVKFKVKNKVYTAITNNKGIATLKLNFNAGKYTIQYFVDGLTGKNTYTVHNKITMTILKWGNRGDVSKVKLIRQNMPNNKWVKKAVAATKKGNPLLKFEGGKGKKVFIISGVHGNELSSQVAAMKLIKYLSNHPIKGTVYIIPFVNIKAITHKVRHTGVDYNRVAPKPHTISNKIVKLVVKYKCDSFGDLHTTQPGGLPGDNIVMGSKSPTAKSAALTKYIAKHAKVHKRIYKYAGQEYPTAFQDTLNKKGIASVVCEVMLPHNTITSKTVATSFNMARALLKFNKVIS